ncbi:MAG: hypothetical protein WD648_14280 [Planctomycetaceae bacterium]
MTNPTVTCPNCGRPLRLRDPTLLGRRATCPKCQHRFVLTKPDEPRIEPSDEEAPSDDDWQLLSDPNEMPAASENPLPPGGPAASSTRLSSSKSAERGGLGWGGKPPKTSSALDDTSTAARLREIRNRDRRKRKIAALTGGLLAVTCVVIYVAISRQPVQQAAQNSKPAPTESAPAVDEIQTPANASIAATREPIRLLYVPAGAGIVINLHPARLWRDGKRRAELRQCLGPLAQWTEAKLREICSFDPAEIDEAMLCLILGPRGTPPELAAVVRLVDERQPGEFERKFPGKAVTKDEHTFTVSDKHAYFVDGGRTVAIAPAALIDEMAAAIAAPAVTDPGIEALLSHTDRSRDLTLIFRPDDIRVHEEFLLSQELRPLSGAILAWLGEEVETVGWSLQFDDPFDSELLVRNKSAVDNRQLKAAQLEQVLAARLKTLPRDVLARVEKMSPRTAGRRQLIGRLPAMVQAVALAIESSTGERFARFSTRLPERAAPNLALAARLAWIETRQPERTAASQTQTDATPSQTPKPIVERLETKLEIDFRRTPLEEAFEFIGSEAGFAVKIDGKGLETAGYTRNMPQQLQLGTVTAKAAIQAIVKQYDKMVIVVDEKAGAVTVTTQAAAEKNGWTIFPVAP